MNILFQKKKILPMLLFPKTLPYIYIKYGNYPAIFENAIPHCYDRNVTAHMECPRNVRCECDTLAKERYARGGREVTIKPFIIFALQMRKDRHLFHSTLLCDTMRFKDHAKCCTVYQLSPPGGTGDIEHFI